ncbi:MAG TPA: hypothetical protein VN734_05730 [Acidobacteriaceae bacterium]|nr:hypothetical protein [Acidobacteriaceae bacterium]
MMFTTLSAKLAGMKAKVLAGTVVAGAALMLAAPTAQAQHVAFGVTIGAPVYVAPAPRVVYAGPGYYGGYYVRDYDAWHARYWDRDRRFDRDDFYRRDFDRRDFDRYRHVDRDHDRDGRFDRR